METYLVGGAIRDELLNLPVIDRDWVVVGATPEAMLAEGFRPVGKDFPVFLHPSSQEEYALARTERKTAPGYQGFSFHADPSVRLEDDLIRRDLTINAIAMDNDGKLYDPHNGQADLKARLLRHVSPAFVEDPVRILRVARFMAKLAVHGFTVAPETMALMREMVASGEVNALVPERVWAETVKALASHAPQAFIQTLQDCGALRIIYPEIANLFGVPQTERWHPEIDSGIHTLMAMEQSVRLSNLTKVRFAVMVHDLGKAVTPEHILPSHRGHEEAGLPLIEQLCDRLKVPNDYRRLALKVCRWHLQCHTVLELRPQTVLKMLEALDAFRRIEEFDLFLLSCEADVRGRLGLEDRPYPQADYLRDCLEACLSIDSGEIAQAQIDKARIPQAIHRARLNAIKQLPKPKSPAH